MKTKFFGTPTGHAGKQVRQTLRRYGQQAYQDLLATIKPGEYSKLKLAFGYMLPSEERRGYFFATDFQGQSLRFYLSPAAEPGRYIGDRIEYVYTRNSAVHIVVLDCSKEQRLKDLFSFLERTGAVRVEMEKVQTKFENV